MAIPSPRSIVDWIVRADALLKLEEKLERLVDNLQRRVADLEKEVAELKNREAVLIAEAKGAAGVAASAATNDLARRIGQLEERTRNLRLPSD